MGEFFNGRVEGVQRGKRTKDRLYWIIYEDGDNQHLAVDQVKEAMVLPPAPACPAHLQQDAEGVDAQSHLQHEDRRATMAGELRACVEAGWELEAAMARLCEKHADFVDREAEVKGKDFFAELLQLARLDELMRW